MNIFDICGGVYMKKIVEKIRKGYSKLRQTRVKIIMIAILT